MCRDKTFDVSQKVIWCQQKQVDVARKGASCQQNNLMLPKKVFHVGKNKMMLNQESILCLKNLLIFFGKYVNNMYNLSRCSVYYKIKECIAHCMMSLEGGKIRCAVFLCGHRKAGRAPM